MNESRIKEIEATLDKLETSSVYINEIEEIQTEFLILAPQIIRELLEEVERLKRCVTGWQENKWAKQCRYCEFPGVYDKNGVSVCDGHKRWGEHD